MIYIPLEFVAKTSFKTISGFSDIYFFVRIIDLPSSFYIAVD